MECDLTTRKRTQRYDITIFHYVVDLNQELNNENRVVRHYHENQFNMFLSHTKECIFEWRLLRELNALTSYHCYSGSSLLHVAAQWRMSNVVEFLLKSGFDPNVRDSRLQTPLYKVCSLGESRIVSLLLLYGADPNLPSDSGNMPMHWVKDECCINLLIKYKAKINRRNHFGETALHFALSDRLIDKVLLLVQNNVKLIPFPGGISVHGYAAKYDISPYYVQLLLQAEFTGYITEQQARKTKLKIL